MEEVAQQQGGRLLVLGLDSSTQGVKAVAIRADELKVVAEWSVNYDLDLPHYATRGGVHHFKDCSDRAGRGQMDEGEVTAPTLMWAEALQLLFEKMKKGDDAIFSRFGAVSASGQQHGSVYWRKGAEASNLALLRLEDQAGLLTDLMQALKHGQGAFSVPVRSLFLTPIELPPHRRRGVHALVRACVRESAELAHLDGQQYHAAVPQA
jgi:hypothetical protein